MGISGAVHPNAKARVLGAEIKYKLEQEAEIGVVSNPILILPYATTVLADNPIAYWRLGDAGPTIAVDEIAARNATQFNGVGFGNPSLLGSDADNDSLLLASPGNGYLEVPSNSVFNFTNGSNDLPFSIESLVNKPVIGRDGSIVSKSNRIGVLDDNEYIMRVAQDGKIDTFLIGTGVGNRHRTVTVSSHISLNTTYHIVWTYDGSASSGLIYINGVSVPVSYSDTGTYTYMPITTIPLNIGLDLKGDSLFTYQGILDEVAMYDKVLTPEQVSAHYLASI